MMVAAIAVIMGISGVSAKTTPKRKIVVSLQ